MTIQAGRLPFIGHGGIPEQQVGHGHVGGGGGGAQTMMSSSQLQLSALDNLQTKTALLAVDRILERAQATIYERPAQMAAAGLAQVIQSTPQGEECSGRRYRILIRGLDHNGHVSTLFHSHSPQHSHLQIQNP